MAPALPIVLVLSLLACGDGSAGDAASGNHDRSTELPEGDSADVTTGDEGADASVRVDSSAVDGGRGVAPSGTDAQAAHDAGAQSSGPDASSAGEADAGGAVEPPSGSLLIVGVGAWGLRGRSADGASWDFCGNPSTGDDHTPDLLRNVGYGGGVFVAVGGDSNSMVMRSVDGAHWEEDLHPTTACDGELYPASCTNWMGGVAHGDGVWLAGGGNGALMRSTDGGRSWEGLHPDPRPPAVRDNAYGSGRFVVGADQCVVGVSGDDGDSWTLHTLWEHSFSVAHGDGTVIAWGARWNGSGFDRACFVSADAGESFQACDALVAESDAFAHDGTRWIAAAAGGHATSPDGLNWTPQAGDDVPGALLHDGARWLGRSGAQVRSATDPVSWATLATDVDGFRAWTVGLVHDANLPVTGLSPCQDSR